MTGLSGTARISLSSAMFVDLFSPATSSILIGRSKKVTLMSGAPLQMLNNFQLEAPRALRQKTIAAENAKTRGAALGRGTLLARLYHRNEWQKGAGSS